MTADMTHRYSKVPDLDTAQVPDGYVVYLSNREKVFFLNNTAAAILELCDGEHTLEEIRRDPGGPPTILTSCLTTSSRNRSRT